MVARIVRDLGFHLGCELNPALDNLWFTVLFRRPALAGQSTASLRPGLRLFTKAMLGEPWEGEAELRFLEEARADTIRLMSRAREGRDWEKWATTVTASLEDLAGPASDDIGWGWKESCAHVFLPQLAEAIPGMRYIHVIRNGLELSHSMLTQFQLFLWGPSYGVDLPDDPFVPAPQAMLKFWVAANQRALTEGESLLGERLLVLRYEEICSEPRSAVKALAEFLGTPVDAGQVERMASFVTKAPPSRRQALVREFDFDPSDLAAVAALGFDA